MLVAENVIMRTHFTRYISPPSQITMHRKEVAQEAKMNAKLLDREESHGYSRGKDEGQIYKHGTEATIEIAKPT